MCINKNTSIKFLFQSTVFKKKETKQDTAKAGKNLHKINILNIETPVESIFVKFFK